jgi:hypothetical protein
VETTNDTTQETVQDGSTADIQVRNVLVSRPSHWYICALLLMFALEFELYFSSKGKMCLVGQCVVCFLCRNSVS